MSPLGRTALFESPIYAHYIGISSNRHQLRDRMASTSALATTVLGKASPSALAWLNGSEPTAASTSNVASAELAFQRWYRFKEAFSPRFVADTVAQLGFTPNRCTDPFGGSGTTGLTCQMLGIPSTTIEVNPFLADLIEAKLTPYDSALVMKRRAQLAERFSSRRRSRSRKVSLPGAPETFVEPGRNGRWIFDRSVAQRIAEHRDAIDEIREPSIRRLFRVVLGGLLVSVSNVLISGKGRRYRAESARGQAVPNDVDRLFEAGFQRTLYDICRYRRSASVPWRVRRADSRFALADCEESDLVLFSPPYPNSFDYTDVYNVELWTLGYLASSRDNRTLREATLRSHVQIKRDFSVDELPSRTLDVAVRALRRVRERLWDPHIPEMIQAYAADLHTILQSARSILTDRGRVVMVVGDSRYRGIHIDVPQIVREIARSTGLTVRSVRRVRQMRSSAQQGGIESLRESMVTLEPC